MTDKPHHARRAKSSALADSDPVVLVLTIGFIVLFVGASVVGSDYVASLIGSGFTWTATYLGSFFQLLLLLTFFIAVGTAFSRAGAARVGGLDRPEIGRFRWLSMIMCTLLAGGGVFLPPVSRFIILWSLHLRSIPKQAPPLPLPPRWLSRLPIGVFWPGRFSGL